MSRDTSSEEESHEAQYIPILSFQVQTGLALVKCGMVPTGAGAGRADLPSPPLPPPLSDGIYMPTG